MKKQTFIILIAILLLGSTYLNTGAMVLSYYDTYYVIPYHLITRTMTLMILLVLFVVNLVGIIRRRKLSSQ